MIMHEPAITHELKRLEAVCPRCHQPGDAICPHCKAEYEDGSLLDVDWNIPENRRALLGLEYFMEKFLKARNKRLWSACFLISTGHARAGGKSMVELAKDLGVTKACVSKTCVAISKMLSRPSRYMRQEAAREVYRKTNRRNGK